MRADVAERAGAGLHQQRIGVAVVTALELDDLVAAGKAARQTDGGHGRLGAGADHAHHIHRRQQLAQAVGHLRLQHGRRAELRGRIRDQQTELPGDGIAPPVTENHTLRAQVRQLTHDNRRLEERLAGARDTNRFLDKRIADLEAELLAAPPQGQQEAPQCT